MDIDVDMVVWQWQCPLQHLPFTFLVFSSVESLFYCRDMRTRVRSGSCWTASTQPDDDDNVGGCRCPGEAETERSQSKMAMGLRHMCSARRQLLLFSSFSEILCREKEGCLCVRVCECVLLDCFC